MNTPSSPLIVVERMLDVQNIEFVIEFTSAQKTINGQVVHALCQNLQSGMLNFDKNYLYLSRENDSGRITGILFAHTELMDKPYVYVTGNDAALELFLRVMFSDEDLESRLEFVDLTSHGIGFASYPDAQQSIFDSAVEKYIGSEFSTSSSPCFVWVAPRGDGVEPKQQPGIDVEERSLSPPDCKVVNATWAYKGATSLERIERQAQYLPSVGLFVTEEEEPAAWAMYQLYGAIGQVYTREEYRRKNLASVAVEKLSEKLFRLGITPFAFVVERNDSSNKMFTRLGWEKEDDTYSWRFIWKND